MKLEGFKDFTQRNRPFFRVLGLAVLLGGTIWSITALELDWRELRMGPLLLNLCVWAPMILFMAATTLRLTARALGREIAFLDAVIAVARANVADLLPLPGGAIVRGAALMQVGASLSESARMVTLTAILTLTLTVSISALGFVALAHPVGVPLLLAGFAGSAVTAWLLARAHSWMLTMAMIGARIVSVLLAIFAVLASFAVLGGSVSFLQSMIIVASPMLGSAVSIVPAGFGVNEAIAAALAALIEVPPAAAFLAIALNRAVGLAAGAVIAGLAPLLARQRD